MPLTSSAVVLLTIIASSKKLEKRNLQKATWKYKQSSRLQNCFPYFVLTGYIPGPIWFGLILDRSCIYWSPKCLGKSSCLLYDNMGLRFSFTGLCIACGFAYCLVFMISFVWMELHKEKYEKSLTVPTDRFSESENNLPNNALWK